MNIPTRTALVLAAALIVSGARAADMKRVGIAQFGLAPQLDQVVTSLKAELQQEGFLEGKSIAYDYDQVNFDTSLVPQLLTKLSGASPDAIVTITTPVSQAAKQVLAGSRIPVVFSAVTDPVAAKLVSSWTQGAPDMTGASDLQDASLVLAFARQLLPKATRLGIPYNPGEDNDRALVEHFKKAAPEFGFTIVEVGIDNVGDIPIRVTSLREQADAIYVGGSNLIQPAIPAVAAAAGSVGIPIVNSDPAPVKSDLALASYAVDYIGVGRNTGKILGRVLRGEQTSAIAPMVPSKGDYGIVVSSKQLAQMNMGVPAFLADCGCIVP